MMTPLDPQLQHRLVRAVDHPIPEVVRVRHLRAITAAASAVAPATGQARVALRRAPRRMWRLALAGAAVLLLPVAAWAAQGTVPGDLLYTVKRATEPVLGLVDPAVVARHRIEEVEALLAAQAPRDRVFAALQAAMTASTGLPPADPLRHRLARVSEVAALAGSTSGTAAGAAGEVPTTSGTRPTDSATARGTPGATDRNTAGEPGADDGRHGVDGDRRASTRGEYDQPGVARQPGRDADAGVSGGADDGAAGSGATGAHGGHDSGQAGVEDGTAAEDDLSPSADPTAQTARTRSHG